MIQTHPDLAEVYKGEHVSSDETGVGVVQNSEFDGRQILLHVLCSDGAVKVVAARKCFKWTEERKNRKKQPQKPNYLVFAIVVAVAISVGFGLVLLRSPADDSCYLVHQADEGSWYTKGTPKVVGNTCTFIDRNTGQTITISGKFHFRSQVRDSATGRWIDPPRQP